MATANTNGGRRKRALLINEDTAVRTTLLGVLTALGLEADAATTGAEGLALFARSRYDVVLTDLGMRGTAGGRMLEAVRQRNTLIPVIIVGGAAVRPDDRRLAQPGVALVTKPVDTASLVAALARVMPDFG